MGTSRRTAISFVLSCAALASCSHLSFCQSHRVDIAGTISEARSGEAIIGINVMLFPDSVDAASSAPVRGCVTNKFGFYSIPRIPVGSYRLVVRGVGYRLYQKNLRVSLTTSDIRLNVSVEQQDVAGPEVVVLGAQKINPLVTMKAVDLDVQFAKRMPSLGGESDVFRTLQLLPGVKAVSELSSGLYIRGGSADQNLILLDGVTVYNPFHLGGFLSTFNSDAVQDIRLLKSGFPAEYGGRLSSVVDITMKEGTKERISGSAAVNLINSRLTLEGPISKDVTFMVSGRRMYLDLIMALANMRDSPKYYFYDLNAKTNVTFSESDRLFVSGYFGRDVFTPGTSGSDFDISWGNYTGNLRWMHIVSSSIFTNFSAIVTDYSFSAAIRNEGSSDEIFDAISRIRDYTLRGEIQWSLAENHVAKAGSELTHHGFRVSAATHSVNLLNSGDLTNIGSADLSAYAQDEWMIAPEISLNVGGRSVYFDDGKYLRFEPRISAAYHATDDLTISASAAQVHQFLHLLNRNDIAIPTDIWFPSNKTVGPSTALQGTLGVEYALPGSEYALTSEVYYKDMRDLYEYKDNAEFSFGVPLESQLTSGKGNAYGWEIFAQKRLGVLTGWIGYTLAWTKEIFPDLNNGIPFYPRYDRRHDVSIVAAYRLSEGWEVGATWMYATGQAYTMPTGLYDFEGPFAYANDESIRADYSLRNAYRLPPFHKLDLNFIRKFTWLGLPFEFSFSVYNVYNRMNPYFQYVEFTDQYDPATGLYVPHPRIRQITLFPVIPTFGLSFTF